MVTLVVKVAMMSAMFEIVLEALCTGCGYLILRAARSDRQHDDSVCAIVGLVFWVAMLAGIAAVVWIAS